MGEDQKYFNLDCWYLGLSGRRSYPMTPIGSFQTASEVSCVTFHLVPNILLNKQIKLSKHSARVKETDIIIIIINIINVIKLDRCDRQKYKHTHRHQWCIDGLDSIL